MTNREFCIHATNIMQKIASRSGSVATALEELIIGLLEQPDALFDATESSLLKMPGVGPVTARVTIAIASGRPEQEILEAAGRPSPRKQIRGVTGPQNLNYEFRRITKWK